MDGIQNYRLDMTDKLFLAENKSLQHYWSEKLERYFEIEIKEKKNILLNLASSEYSKVLNKGHIRKTIIDVHFKMKTAKAYKTIGMYSKQARGALVNYIIKNKIDNPEYIKSFSNLGFSFNSKLSSDNDYTFIREK